MDTHGFSQTPIRILRRKEVLRLLGVSSTTLWRWTRRDDSFPRPIRLGPNSVGFRESDLQRWLDERATVA